MGSVTALFEERQSSPLGVPDALGVDVVPWAPYQWRVKVVRFANGGHEVSVRAIDRTKAKERYEAFGGHGAPRSRIAPTEERAQDNIRRSRHRAKTRVRHLAKTMGVTHLLTLSTRQRANTRDEMLDYWRRFLRLYARARGERLDFIMVIERHPTNPEHLHIHAAVTSFLPVGLLRRLWYLALGGTGGESGADTPGGVNMQQIRASHPGRRAARIARYIAKYMTKDTAEEFNKKRFSASKGAVIESASYWLAAPCEGPGSLGGALAEVIERVRLSFSREDHYVFPDGRGFWCQVVQGDDGPNVFGADPPF